MKVKLVRQHPGDRFGVLVPTTDDDTNAIGTIMPSFNDDYDDSKKITFEHPRNEMEPYL